jgi:hypothetical protein
MSIAQPSPAAETAPLPSALPPTTDAAAMRDAILAKLTYAVGKNPVAASDRDWFVATALRGARPHRRAAGSPRPRRPMRKGASASITSRSNSSSAGCCSTR